MPINHLNSETHPVCLETLSEGTPGITPADGKAYAEAAAVCLEKQGHSNGIPMQIFGDFSENYIIFWNQVTDQMRRCHLDIQDATELGAYGFAALLLPKLTDLTIVSRSWKGTGFDFWLGKKSDGDILFQGKTRLEISGILKGSRTNIDTRVKEKIRQTDCSDGEFPAIIFVSEFSQPCSKVVNK